MSRPWRMILAVILWIAFGLGPVPLHSPAAAREFEPAAPAGYRLTEEKNYRPQNLFEYIDGQAEQYLQYGFESLVSLTYEQVDTKSVITLDIYRLATPLDACGLYLGQGADLTDRLGLGSPSSGDRAGASLVRDRYLVKALTRRPGPEADQAMKTLLKGAAQGLPPSALPPELDLLPPEGREPGSLRYVKDGVLRLAELPRGLSGKYAVNGQRAELGLAVFESPDQAVRAKEALVARLSRTQSRPAQEIKNLPEGWMAVRDKYRGGMILAVHGPHVMIAARLQDFPTGINLLEILQGRLP